MPARALFVIGVQKSLADDPKTEIPSAAGLKASISSILETARQHIQNGGSVDLKIFMVQHDDPDDDTLRADSEGWKLVFQPQNENEKVLRKQHRESVHELVAIHLLITFS